MGALDRWYTVEAWFRLIDEEAATAVCWSRTHEVIPGGREAMTDDLRYKLSAFDAALPLEQARTQLPHPMHLSMSMIMPHQCSAIW